MLMGRPISRSTSMIRMVAPIRMMSGLDLSQPKMACPINIFATNALRAAGDVNYPFYVGLVVQWSCLLYTSAAN